jgi:hypothetical protein
MDNNKKYLEKFYKRNITIDEIKKTYDSQRSSPPLEQTAAPPPSPPPSLCWHYLHTKEVFFLWLFSAGLLFQLHQFFNFV